MNHLHDISWYDCLISKANLSKQVFAWQLGNILLGTWDLTLWSLCETLISCLHGSVKVTRIRHSQGSASGLITPLWFNKFYREAMNRVAIMGPQTIDLRSCFVCQSCILIVNYFEPCPIDFCRTSIFMKRSGNLAYSLTQDNRKWRSKGSPKIYVMLLVIIVSWGYLRMFSRYTCTLGERNLVSSPALADLFESKEWGLTCSFWKGMSLGLAGTWLVSNHLCK